MHLLLGGPDSYREVVRQLHQEASGRPKNMK